MGLISSVTEQIKSGLFKQMIVGPIDSIVTNTIYNIHPVPEMASVWNPCAVCTNPDKGKGECNCVMNQASRRANNAWVSLPIDKKKKLLKKWGVPDETMKDPKYKRYWGI